MNSRPVGLVFGWIKVLGLDHVVSVGDEEAGTFDAIIPFSSFSLLTAD